MEKERQNKARHLKRVREQINNSHEQARLDRLEHELNMKKASQDLYNSKHNDYSSTKQKQRELEVSMQNFKKEEGERKRARNQEIR